MTNTLIGLFLIFFAMYGLSFMFAFAGGFWSFKKTLINAFWITMATSVIAAAFFFGCIFIDPEMAPDFIKPLFGDK